jgi:ABC-type antimicrobial peptide transport system ATPase subunit
MCYNGGKSMVKRNIKTWFRHGNWWRRLRNNRKYRDVLFRRLFRDKKDLLDLYNALNGSTYQNPEELEVITLEDVFCPTV